MDRPLRIASANLLNGGADPGALAELIERHEVDVLATQELAPAQADAIARVLPHGILDPDADFRGMGIASRFPCASWRVPMRFRDAPVIELELAGTPALAHLETHQADRVEIACTHVVAPHTRSLRRRPWLRHQQLGDLLRYLRERPASARALVGDFNATPLWPVYRRISAQLTDAAIAVAQTRGRRVAATWGPGPGAPRWLRIDHGFVSGLAPVEFQVVEVRGSDHSAIVMDVVPF